MIRQFNRIPGFRRLWNTFPFGSVQLRTEFDIWDRPNYAYGLFMSAQQAKALGIGAISAIEFGVAGGTGLVAMENIAAKVTEELGVQISVFGFDLGKGMPVARDYRDLPYVWESGFFEMDVKLLKDRLQRAELILGPVSETVPQFLSKVKSNPIGFVAFDLDYYSSTKEAFGVLRGGPETRLPRTYCYFDDIVWPERACHNDYTGELLAIREYNQEHSIQKISKINLLSWMRARAAMWNEQMYIHHDFEHPLYTALTTPQGAEHRQLPLR
jgi:hypothetical protein